MGVTMAVVARVSHNAFDVVVSATKGTMNQTTTAYVTWHRQDHLLYGTFVEPTLVPLVLLTTTSKALWDTLATTTTVTATIAHPLRNQIRPVRYVNDAYDDSDRPNKKMKRMIKVTPKKKVDEYTPPYLTKRIKQDPIPVGPTHQAFIPDCVPRSVYCLEPVESGTKERAILNF
nr:hypothetical protein [Tanacetum cinerariifolium]